jgi:hypothetical protein
LKKIEENFEKKNDGRNTISIASAHRKQGRTY